MGSFSTLQYGLTMCLVLSSYAVAQTTQPRSAPAQSDATKRILEEFNKPAPPKKYDPDVERWYMDGIREQNVPQPVYPRQVRDLPPDLQKLLPDFYRQNYTVPRLRADPNNPNQLQFDRSIQNVQQNAISTRFRERQTSTNWFNWWEINRLTYWPARSDSTPRAEPAGPSVAVHQALVKGTTSRNPYIQAQSALALAMTRYPKSMDVLPALTRAPDDTASIHAWAAIGLLDTTESRKFLETPPTRPRDQVGWALAVGLTSHPTQAMWDALYKLADESEVPEIWRLTLWAMRMHQPPGTREKFLEALWHAADHTTYYEIFRGLASLNDPRDQMNFVHLANSNPSGVDWPAIAGMYRVSFKGTDLARNTTDALRIHEYVGEPFLRAGINTNIPDLLRNRPRPTGPIRMTGKHDFKKQYDERNIRYVAFNLLRRMRIPALSALTDYQRLSDPAYGALTTFMDVSVAQPVPSQTVPNGGLKTSVVRRNPTSRPTASSTPAEVQAYYQSYYQGNLSDEEKVVLDEIYLALGRMGSAQEVERFRDALSVDTFDPADAANNIYPRIRNKGSRGAAAIALGLYLRAGGARTDGGNIRSPITNRTIPSAGDYLLDHFQVNSEFPGVRAASALAMGISGNTAFAGRMKAVFRLLEPGQELVYGYGLLGLGILGDPDTVQLASRGLGPARETIDVDRLIDEFTQRRTRPMSRDELTWRRAAVGGLAALGDPRALPLLYGEWGKDDSLNLEVARAVARCRVARPGGPSDNNADPFIDAMIQLMAQDKAPALSAGAAASLGLVYEKDISPRLATITDQLEFTRRPAPLNASGHMNLERAYQAPVLGLANPYYFLVVQRNARRPNN